MNVPFFVLTCIVTSALAWSGMRPRVVLRPIDEGPTVAAFAAYRDRLLSALERRDAEAVVQLMHPDLQKSNTATVFRLSPSELGGGREGGQWAALIELLRLGGTFTRGVAMQPVSSTLGQASREFCAPYVYSAYPRPMPDVMVAESPGDPWVVLKPDVRVRRSPPSDMTVIDRLSYDLVHLQNAADPNGGSTREWIGIVTPGGAKGYVSSRLVRGPYEYFACFGDFSGVWRMTVFGRAP